MKMRGIEVLGFIDNSKDKQGSMLEGIPFSPNQFDLVINCSTVEHVGLAGRYGITEHQPNGDIEAMAHLWNIMKPNGIMILTIPVGKDEVFVPLHRVYGRERLPSLLSRFAIEKEEY